MTWDPYLTPAGWNGVTTLVIGNCGVGVAPIKPLDMPRLMLTAEWDPDLRSELAADVPQRCSQLEMHLVGKSGHWMQQEH